MIYGVGVDYCGLVEGKVLVYGFVFVVVSVGGMVDEIWGSLIV